MDAAIWTEGEDAVNHVLQGAIFAEHFSLKLLLPVVLNGRQRPALELHADANAKAACRLGLEFHRLQTVVEFLQYLTECNGLCVFYLLFGRKLILSRSVTAIWAMAWKIAALSASTKRDFEVSFALWALSPCVSIRICVD